MPSTISQTPRALLAFCIGAKLAIYFLSLGRYGYLSDELYFLDASHRLAAGYVDFPPLIAWIYAGLRFSLGDSLAIIRGAATVIGTLTVLLAVDLCRRMGGGHAALWIVACVALFAPGVLSVQTLLTMNVIDQLWWLSAFWFLNRYLDTNEPASMLWLGAVIGIGILTKLSMLVFVAGAIVSALIWRRDLFKRREVLLAAAVAAVIFSPHLVWQINNGFPVADFIGAYSESPPAAIVLQNPALGLLITMHPLYALVWVTGAVSIFFIRAGQLRFLGTVGWVSLVVFAVADVKFYFAVPVALFFSVAGAIFIERYLQTHVAIVLVIIFLAGGMATVPIAAPVLAEKQLQSLVDAIHQAESRQRGEAHEALERYFPHFAEMHGWPELTELTTGVFREMRSQGRLSDHPSVVAAHYGQAAALNQLAEEGVLPEVLSGHMNYDLWNRDEDLGAGLYIGFDEQMLQPLFANIDLVARLECQRCMSREQNLAIYLASDPLVSSDAIRETIRRYYFF